MYRRAGFVLLLGALAVGCGGGGLDEGTVTSPVPRDQRATTQATDSGSRSGRLDLSQYCTTVMPGGQARLRSFIDQVEKAVQAGDLAAVSGDAPSYILPVESAADLMPTSIEPLLRDEISVLKQVADSEPSPDLAKFRSASQAIDQACSPYM